MPNKNPIRWKIVLLMNLAMLGGCIVAAFIVPPNTRFSIFVFSCVAVVIGFNILFYFKGYRRAEPKPAVNPAKPKVYSTEAKRRRRNLVMVYAIGACGLLWEIWEVGSRYWWK